MTEKQLEHLTQQITAAAALIMKKHGVEHIIVESIVHEGSIVLKVTPQPLEGAAHLLTKNAVARYKAKQAQLKLPALGTELMIAGELHKLVGLSSDCARVKATTAAGGGKIKDVPIGAVKQSLVLAGSTEVAKLEAHDDIEQVDQAAALLAAMASKKPL